ncbi:MAG TPA: YiiD C-terminal domain-containing protein [Clostridia bacterium]
MDITKIPFNDFIKIKKAEKEGHILEIQDKPQYLNHLGTVHASAQFALAEATSGQYLLEVFKEYAEGGIIPVVRAVETKYKKPAKGDIYSNASMSEEDIEKVRGYLRVKGRAILEVAVQVRDSEEEVTMVSKFTWFIQVIN